VCDAFQLHDRLSPCFPKTAAEAAQGKRSVSDCITIVIYADMNELLLILFIHLHACSVQSLCTGGI
jgi:hypothetical protein